MRTVTLPKNLRVTSLDDLRDISGRELPNLIRTDETQWEEIYELLPKTAKDELNRRGFYYVDPITGNKWIGKRQTIRSKQPILGMKRAISYHGIPVVAM